MGDVEAAGDDEGRAGDGEDIGDLAEDEVPENADPEQLRIGERRQHGGIAVAIGQHDDPLAAVEATPMKMPSAIAVQDGVTQTNGTSTVRITRPVSEEYAMVVTTASRPLIMRVRISVPAQHAAEINGKTAAG